MYPQTCQLLVYFTATLSNTHSLLFRKGSGGFHRKAEESDKRLQKVKSLAFASMEGILQNYYFVTDGQLILLDAVKITV